MPAYHSTLNDTKCQTLCKMSILPLKTKYKGPAPPQEDQTKDDIIDEALNFFKANVLFRNYEVKGTADTVLVYLTLYIQQCLTRINGAKGNAEKQLYQLAIESFALPGDAKFILGGYVSNPSSRTDSDTMRSYFTQLRQETGQRLIARVYKNDANKPDKWWMCFSKKKFLNKTL
eukprot:TRINITY_DN35326_c0_g1_i1.p1 TRINITY_DN35326_c0_g1~~TRINITY_DN35326_c0_g1_i1.p1  ORF type:complete len:174 (-),score=24.22 TRINITY_DN35326_c0_g1_i1:29-550(-)